MELVKGGYYGGVTLKVTCLWTVSIICGLIKGPVHSIRSARFTCSPLWHLLLTYSLYVFVPSAFNCVPPSLSPHVGLPLTRHSGLLVIRFNWFLFWCFFHSAIKQGMCLICQWTLSSSPAWREIQKHGAVPIVFTESSTESINLTQEALRASGFNTNI